MLKYQNDCFECYFQNNFAILKITSKITPINAKMVTR
jgi:hypothetical protein